MRSVARNEIRRVPGQYVVEAMDRLPACGPDSTSQQLEIDTEIWGRFRITYTPWKHTPRGWSTRWFWVAKSAERLARY